MCCSANLEENDLPPLSMSRIEPGERSSSSLIVGVLVRYIQWELTGQVDGTVVILEARFLCQ